MVFEDARILSEVAEADQTRMLQSPIEFRLKIREKHNHLPVIVLYFTFRIYRLW
jgi:5-hydroxyisourate hydrolase-like protein (transthyretin family)